MDERRISLSVEEWHRLVREGAYLPVTITLSGYSMQPLIRYRRDPVVVVPIDRPPLPGDIVVFIDRLGRYCVHRVRRVAPGRVETLGDNCLAPDGWTEEENVLGILLSVTRGKRVIELNTLRARRLGRLWMLALPIRRAYRRVRGAVGKVYHRIRRR